MKTSAVIVVAAAAHLAAATGDIGGAKVINKCSYPIPIENTPSLGVDTPGASSHRTTLAAAGQGDDSYYTSWSKLLSGGWSIKVDDINDPDDIGQFEYTWAPDGQIWYDYSFVDGNETKHALWEFDCPDAPEPPHKLAYQFDKDDKRGMQKPVQPYATVTLILCPENASAGSGSGSSSGSDSPSSSAPSPSEAYPSPEPSTTLQTTTSAPPAPSVYQNNVVEESEPAPEPVETPTATESDVVMVTAFETKVITNVVYETAAARKKRHVHRHPHGHSA